MWPYQTLTGEVALVAALALDGEVVPLAPGPAVEPAGAEGRVHRRRVRRDHEVDAVEVGQRLALGVPLPVAVEATQPQHRAGLVAVEQERPRPHQPDVDRARAQFAAVDQRAQQMLGVRDLKPGVHQHFEVVRVRLGEPDAHLPEGQHLDRRRRSRGEAEIAAEVRRRPHAALVVDAEGGQLEPEGDIVRGEGLAVVPGRVAAQGKRPLGEVGRDRPVVRQTGADQVDVLPAPENEVARPEEPAAGVVQRDAAGAHRIEGRRRIAPVGQDEHPAPSRQLRVLRQVRRRRRGRRRRSGRRRWACLRHSRPVRPASPHAAAITATTTARAAARQSTKNPLIAATSANLPTL